MSWCLARRSRESSHADTPEASNHVLTDAILTRQLFAVVDQAVAVCSGPAYRTLADVAVDDVCTDCAILARIRLTFINVDVAVSSCPPRITQTLVAIDLVLALTIDARI